MAKAYRYALVTMVDEDTALAVLSSSTKRKGTVQRMGPNYYRAQRLFGRNLSKVFKGPANAFCTNEEPQARAALAWACGGADLLRMVDRESNDA
jgi:hypothetical protein